MFTVLAINSGVPQQLATRRDRYKCSSFTHALALHQRSGTVTLNPENRVLVVGGNPDDYESIRVFAEDGTVVGWMRRSTDGTVSWTQPMSP